MTRLVAVRDEREGCDFGLLRTQCGVLANQLEEPLAEGRLGLDDSAAEEVGAGVGEVGRNGE